MVLLTGGRVKGTALPSCSGVSDHSVIVGMVMGLEEICTNTARGMEKTAKATKRSVEVHMVVEFVGYL